MPATRRFSSRALRTNNARRPFDNKASRSRHGPAKPRRGRLWSAERGKLAVFEYGRTIQVAHQEWRDNNLAGARALLASTRLDFRGWEWRYVHRLCNSSLLTFKGHVDTVEHASFSADGSRIVTGSRDKTAKVWDAKTGTELLTLKGHPNVVRSAAFSADDSRIVTGSEDGTAKVWDAKTGKELLTLNGHTHWVTSASSARTARGS